MLHQADVDPATTLRAATFGYARGNNVGDLTIDVEVIRRGRTMVTTHARTNQGDKVTTIARFHHFDGSWLTMFGDYFPPAVFTRVTERQRAVTVEYAIQIHSDAGSWIIRDDEYLAARMHAFHSRDGFAVEDGWISLPDGTLLATVRQTRLAG